MEFEQLYEVNFYEIEKTVCGVFRRHRALTDHTVLRVYESLIRIYSAKANGREIAFPSKMDEEEEALFQDLHGVCEKQLEEGTIEVSALILCIKRLVKSVKMWTKRSGYRGYLQFVNKFV